MYVYGYIYIYVFNQLIMTSYWDISIPYDDWMVFSVFSFYSVFFWTKGQSWGIMGMFNGRYTEIYPLVPLVNVYIAMENHHF